MRAPGRLAQGGARRYTRATMSDEANLDELARRYLELWQDQISALASDPEFSEALSRLYDAMGLTDDSAGDRQWDAPTRVGPPVGPPGTSDGPRAEPRRRWQQCTMPAKRPGAPGLPCWPEWPRRWRDPLTMAQTQNQPGAAQTRRAARPRLGPRPLPLHLGLAALAWQSSKAALPLLRSGSLPWTAELALEPPAPCKTASKLDGSAILRPSTRRRRRASSIWRRHHALRHLGISGLPRPPLSARLGTPPTVWQEGTSRLLDYRPAQGGPRSRPTAGRRLRPCWSCRRSINRAYILDLGANASLLRWLAGRGLAAASHRLGRGRAPEERGFTLSDYVAGRLDRALDHAVLAERPAASRSLLGLLHGRAPGPGPRAAPPPGPARPGAARDALGFPCRSRRPRQRLVADSYRDRPEPLLMSPPGRAAGRCHPGLFASLDPLLVVQQVHGLSPCARSERSRCAPVRRPGGLAERRRALGGARGAGVPRPAGTARTLTAKGGWRVAGEAVAAPRVSLPGALYPAGPGPHRAARIGGGPGRAPCPARRSCRRPLSGTSAWS